MDYQPDRRELWEAMESCRPGSDDLANPEFAELAARLADDSELAEAFDRMQRVDAAIKAAFVDVLVPPGLAERLKQRLETAQVETAAIEAAKPSPFPASKVFSRRRLLVGIGSITVAAGLLAAVWLNIGRTPPDTPQSVLTEAMQFFAQDSQAASRPITEVPPPADFPISQDLVLMNGIGWRHVNGLFGGRAVAFDLPSVGGGRATLYVVAPKHVPGLPNMPPWTPSGTAGQSAAAWQVADVVYVLVVEGDSGVYRSYLDRSRGPLT